MLLPLSKRLILCIGLLVVLMALNKDSMAQKKYLPIYLKSGKITTLEKLRDITQSDPFFTSAIFNNKIYLFIQFASLPNREQAKDMGVDLLEYIPTNTYLVSVNKNVSSLTLAKLNAIGLLLIKPEYKLDPSLSSNFSENTDVLISGFPDMEENVMLGASRVKQLDPAKYKSSSALKVNVSTEKLKNLLSSPFVYYIEPVPQPFEILNDESGVIHGSHVLQNDFPGIGRNLSGKDVVIGIGDDGGMGNHPDHFYKTIDFTTFQTYHATIVAGVMAGAGVLNPLYRGHAPKASVLEQVFDNIIHNAPALVDKYGMVLTNNSYGSAIDCLTGGTYSSISSSVDKQLLQYPNLMHVFAAGNTSTFRCETFPPAYRTNGGHYQSAKNTLTVGGGRKETFVNIFSKGPTKDGRIKPEITATGVNVISSVPPYAYGGDQGTSLSAPQVTGVLALLYERYRQLHSNQNPKAALMKAIVCNTATDIGRKGPDFENGFGLLNGLDAVESIENMSYFNDSVQHNGQKTFSIVVPANTQQLKAMLYWPDVAPSLLSSIALVNDLDITIVSPDGTIYKPYILDPSATGVLVPATTGEDHVNNIEQIVIENPIAGNYTVTVKGFNIPSGQQEFFVSHHQKKTGLRLTHPVGNEKLKSNGRSIITWEEPGISQNTYRVEISSNNGSTWQTLGTATGNKQLAFTIPNVASTNNIVRVTNLTNANQVQSGEFIILPSLYPLLSSPCEGMVQVDWPATIGVDSVAVLLWENGEMKTVGFSTGNSFLIQGLSKDYGYIYALQPFKNSYSGERGIATGVFASGTACNLPQNKGDIKLEQITRPISGRKYSSTEHKSNEQVKVLIRNLDYTATAAPIILKLFVNASLYSTDTVITAIAGNDTLTYSFKNTLAFINPNQRYQLNITAEKADDPDTVNNRISMMVKSIPNDPLTLPFKENFQLLKDSVYSYPGYAGIEGLENWDFIPSNVAGKLAVMEVGGTKSFVPFKNKNVSVPTSNSLLVATYNLSNYTLSDNIRMSFLPGGLGFELLVRGSDTSAWIKLPGSIFSQDPIRGKNLNISKILTDSGQNLSSSFQLGLNFFTNTDNFTLIQAFKELSLYTVNDDVRLLYKNSEYPSFFVTEPLPLTFRVVNTVNKTINNVSINLKLPSGKILYDTIRQIAALDTSDFLFTVPPNELAVAMGSFSAWISYPSDSYSGNDSAKVSVNVTSVETKIPFYEGFEDGEKEWNSTFTFKLYNTPTELKIKNSANGKNFWYVRPKKEINNGGNQPTTGEIYSPGINVRGMTNPYLSFSFASYLRNRIDSAYVEYSYSAGKSWTILRDSLGKAFNWYNSPSQYSWSDSSKPFWQVVTVPLPIKDSIMLLSFYFGNSRLASTSLNFWDDAMAVDDIHIYDLQYPIAGIAKSFTSEQKNIKGNDWIPIIENGKIIASINPQDQDISSLNFNAYSPGKTRVLNGNKILTRSFTLTSAASLNKPILLRLYFTHQEAEQLRTQNNCQPCVDSMSAYDFGIYQYTGDVKTINAFLHDNSTTDYINVNSSDFNLVPYDNGYYAEISIRPNREIYITTPERLRPQPLSFTANASGFSKDVKVDWTLANQKDIKHFEVESATESDYDEGIFKSIDQQNVATAGTGNYSFIDKSDKASGYYFYRLKIVYQNGYVVYAPEQIVSFDPPVTRLSIYPNPSTSGIFNVMLPALADGNTEFQLTNSSGQLLISKSFANQGASGQQKIDLSSSRFAKGIYLLKIKRGGDTKTIKLIKL